MPCHHHSSLLVVVLPVILFCQIAEVVQSHSHHHHHHSHNNHDAHHHHRKTQVIHLGDDDEENNNELYEHHHVHDDDSSELFGCNMDDHGLSEEDEHLDVLRMAKLQTSVQKQQQQQTPNARSGSNSNNNKFSLPPIDSIDIDVYAHVLTRQSNSDVTYRILQEEINNLVNVDFQDTPFEFHFKGVDYTSHSRWNDIDGSDDDDTDDATAALRIGGGDVLNLFLAEGLCDANLGGFAQYPYEQGWFPPNQYSHKDRVYLCPSVLLGDSRTVTHEIGHWLGLRHTFNGNSCSSNNEGDFVDDTPQHLNSRTDCDDSDVDTCTNQPGDDPIFNFMSYSRCRFDFTAGQIERMVYQFHEYRRRVFPCASDESTMVLSVVFDNDPDPFQVAYSYYDIENDEKDWRQLKSQDDDSDGFANSRFTRTICMPNQELFGFHLVDEDERGFRSGGYMQLKLNGERLELTTEFDREWQSTFVVAQKCKPSQVQLTLELDPWRFNDETPSWEIRDLSRNRRAVVSRDTTRDWSDAAFRKLYHQVCLEGGGTEYEFTLYGDNNGGFAELRLGPTVLYTHDDGRFDEETTIEIVTLGGGDWTSGGFIGQAPPAPIGACVSGATRVHHETQGWIPLSEIQIGDRIETTTTSSSGGKIQFEPVYAFGHYQPTVVGDSFLELTFRSGSSLQISPDHLVFVAGETTPIPAKDLSVGQSVVLSSSSGSITTTTTTTRLVRIQTNIAAKGIYAPFTPSGTLVVEHGLVLSNYISLERYTKNIPLHYHHAVAHFVTGIHRIVCHQNNNNNKIIGCPNPMYTNDGVNVWEATLLALIQYGILPVLLLLLGGCCCCCCWMRNLRNKYYC
eukprot:CAMPEP_0194244646 /NCGR_PEP_ID=MMETSP0158-20130606/11666_1 /TAXON_ID=33649 /ORGANISM="Thalassionema nitzschioides, Strain L26-B" /LENGTH=846 /DNA_ID=CAMNT_0038980195 /DNA_START=88 /DNA_END=2625 /DNA_ORIENTATION=+